MNPRLVFASALASLFIISAQGALAASTSACPPGNSTEANCGALVESIQAPYSKPVGLTPDQLHTAYNLPTTTTSATPPVIAIIGAYDAPNIASDLKHYSSTFGIPSLPNCKGQVANSAVPCFQKVDQRGGTHFSTDTYWHAGITMEVEAAHAICQNCSILLVESDDSLTNNMYAAVDEAVTLGTKFMVAAFYFTGTENQVVYQSFDAYFNHPGVLIAAPEAVSGYGTFAYPAASAYVTAVGGTTLNTKRDGTYKNESVWSATTSYCDQFENRPDWQAATGCKKRMGADVAMVGDIATGFALYDTTDKSGGGWYLAGGTSLSTALVTGVFALADHSQVNMSALPYQNYSATNFNDITRGSNGTDCDKKAFCTAVKGYDGPSGLGSPNGIGGF